MSEPTSAPAATPGKAKSSKRLILIVAAVVVLGGGGAAAYYFTRPAAAAEGAEAAHEEPAHPTSSGVVSFDPFVVNLADTAGARFLRISVRLVIDDEEQAKHVQENDVLLMRLRSGILELLTEQTSDRLVTPDGKTALKKAIAEHAAGILKPATVSDVLFSDFVVQF